MLHKFLRAIRSNSQDPYFKQVSLLLHGDGTNGSQNNTFLDSSTNNLSITRHVNATQGTLSPFSQDAGYWSNFFDGTGGGASNTDSLSIANNTALQMGSSDFTIEGYFYLNNTPTVACRIFEKADQFSNFEILLILNSASAGSFQYSTNGTSFTTVSLSAAFTVGQWHHIAVTRNSSTLTVWFNGTSIATDTISGSIFSGTSTFKIGNSAANTRAFPCNISNFRVVKGTAVYTASFTPPTVPLTAITNTQLLTCQSNRFVDNSSNNFTITRNGDTSIQPFSPFAPTSAYSSSVNGASGYFDGTLDRLNASGTPLDIMGTGNFTFECYVYLTGSIGSTGFSMLMSQDDGSSGNQGFQLGVSNNLAIRFVWWTGSSRSTAVALSTSNNVVNIRSWNHVAVSWDGTTLRIFVNGSVAASTTSFSPFNSGTSLTGIGNYTGTFTGAGLFGYLASVRIVKGTAVYTATFTPPTAPLTDITNTSLLLNFTNAGIFDNAMKNDLETVGNAQISTSVKQYGSGSLSFDGTGDWLLCYNNGLLPFGREPFTIELWMRANSVSSAQTIVGWGNRTTNNFCGIQLTTAGDINFYNWGNDLSSSGVTIAINTWYHIVCQYDGTIKRIYIDGVQRGSVSTTTVNITATNRATIGAQDGVNFEPVNGYIDDLRITKGVARYTANFTPPSGPYPNS